MTFFSFFSSSFQRNSLQHLLLLTGFALFATSAHAQHEPLKKLMQANNCMACHQIDKRKYGPQFDEIPAKYAGDADAIAKLAAKIKAGGSGVWGEDMMPPQPQVSDADAKTMAELILTLKPGQ